MFLVNGFYIFIKSFKLKMGLILLLKFVSNTFFP